MLKSRGRDTRQITSPTPLQFPNRQQTQPSRPAAVVPSSTRLTLRTPIAQRAPIAKPEPDYEVVEFPSEQYVNAKLQPPPPPPPRPPTGHPAEAGASCGLCGGGGARVRCAECGRRALCASCDDMYHRHPKRRHHQRQALSLSQVRDERPPLPPKVAPPVPPPRRHKISGDRTSASPRPPSADQRNAPFAVNNMMQTTNATFLPNNHMNTLASHHGIPAHLQGKIGPVPGTAHLGSMPYLPNMHVTPVAQPQTNTLGHLASGWARPRNSLPAFNMPPNVQMAVDSWEGAENANAQGWSRPLRRGASVLELGGAVGAGAAPGCGACAGWRYGSCASLDHQQWGWQPPCCGHAPPPPHAHMHAPYTPQPYRRADSRTLSRAQSRACSRAASPAMSTRSRTSRRTRHRTPSPPPLPSSDADSESESDADDNRRTSHYPEKTKMQPKVAEPTPEPLLEPDVEDSLGPAPEPPTSSWQCEHCTFVNEPGVRVCVICCRTPTAAPKIVNNTNNTRKTVEASRSENARSIAASERAVEETARSIAHLDINDDISNTSTSPARPNGETRVQNGTKSKSKPKKERVSSGCGPSPPREVVKKPLNRLITPTRERSAEPVRIRHDIAVGSSPPKEVLRTVDTSTRTSPYREHVKKETIRHSVSVGPSPPCDNASERVSSSVTVQKKSTGTSPPRNNNAESRASSASSRANVSNTGTSPPPQNISTQTYEVPSTFERPASQSRSRRRFRDEARRERSHSRHSLSSDTRESERTSGGGGGGGDGRWEWRWGRDSSPGGEWSGSERRRPAARLARRASHLDLRRTRAPAKRTSYYGSEAASPERTRAVSMEALAGTNAAAERGLELARLMASAEQLGFSAAEVQAALAQAPAAPLSWLRSRWGGLCAGVAAAVARLEPRAAVHPRDARAALARSRGAMWPAVTDCLDRYRRQAGGGGVGGGAGVSVAARVSGRVWGSPAGAEDDAAPPRRADGSSDEAEFRDDDWMYLPLDAPRKSSRDERYWEPWDLPPGEPYGAPDAEAELDRSLITTFLSHDAPVGLGKPNPVDFIQSESDFIEAYNALTRSTPLPGIEARREHAPEKGPKRDTYDVHDNDSRSPIENAAHVLTNKNIITDNTPDMVKTVIYGQQHNNIEPTKAIFEATPVDVDVPQLPTATSNTNNVINTIGITDDLMHSLDVTTSQAVSQINHVSYDNTRETPLDLSDRIPVNDDSILSQTTPSPSYHVSDDNTRRTPLDLSDRIPVTDDSVLSQTTASPSNHVSDDNTRKAPSDLSDRIPVTGSDSVLSQTTSSPSKINIQLENNSNNISMSVRQDDEKLNNLNDIVDTTQKLIQQMKDEINSDINSIDSRNISQSEADSSSNESSDISTEHESSYSESEDDETENQTTDDSSSSADELEMPLSERRPTLVQRTSSEDNDQFEEAMDHIEEQIQDFKNANIEILDSIARSLQEEHTISVEKLDTKHASNSKKQDQNNNVFVEVNSFEEIYAELNTGSTKNTKNDQGNYTQRNDGSHEKSEAVINGNSSIPKIYVPKQQIVVSSLQTATPTKLLISENMGTKYNATIETVDENFNSTGEVVVENLNIREETIDENSNLKQEIVDENSTGEVVVENLNIREEPIDENSNLKQEIVDENLNTAEEIFEDNLNLTVLPEVVTNEGLNLTQETLNDSLQRTVITNETNLINSLDNLDQSIPAIDEDENESTEDDEDTENSEDNEPHSSTVTDQEPITNENQGPNLNVVDEEILLQSGVLTKNVTNVQISTDNLNMEELEKQDKIQNNNTNNNSDISEIETISKESTNNITNKISNSIKSNIPKLIKLVQGNKQKVEKPSPKIIASKVPIRRGSLKQYPAPAPPKSHFGHIQSGHVKQLQTRLFNNKLPKTAVNVPTTVEVNPSVEVKASVAVKPPMDSKATVDVKPSTSTLNKKKQAPPPPVPESVQISPTQTLVVPKEKKGSYFRESCRTEDEWTDSDSEDSQIVRVAKADEEPERVPSPPPPVTLRRVSGKLIDLAKIQFPEGSPERQARMVLAQGGAETWEQARLAAELTARGAEPAAALLAALQCVDLAAALAYLHQDCELCASRLPEHEMVSMLRCTHRCCRECARHYFTVQITERSIADCVCPYCKVPDLEEIPEDAWLEYFAHLDILLKTLLDAEVHELFQRKLRDRTLARDPNFRWCMECSSGFFVHPKQKRVRCPECRSQSCAKCRKPWSANHEGLSCEQYLTWLEDNDPERSVAAVQQHLRENGLECPRCHFKYSLSRGGCMHFTCTQCKYEFCNGCGKPFMMGARCGLSEYCAKLGLHAHHPRNCLFYLRDKEPHQLQTLLQMNDVPYETEAPEGSTNRCPIQLQRETPTGLVDGICGNDVPPKHAGLCKPHYVEYLAGRARALDPIPVMDLPDLVAELRRRALPLPERGPWDSDPIYAGMCAQIVKEKIPLE